MEKTSADTPTNLNTDWHPWDHLLRIWLPIRKIEPNSKESALMDRKDVPANQALRSFCAWRRSMLAVAFPVVFLTMILEIISLFNLLNDGQAVFSSLGKFLIFTDHTSSLVLVVALGYSIFIWNNIAQSTRSLRIGWFASFVMPLSPALFPLESIIKRGLLSGGTNISINLMKVELAISYAMVLLPTLVTIPSGATRASLRVRSLVPNSNLPGWLLLVSAPFYSLVILISLVVITQIAGDVFLLIGAVLLVIAPWVFIVRAKLFVGLQTPDVERKIVRASRVAAALAALGAIFVLTWALTAEVSGVRPLGKRPDSSSSTGDSNNDDYFDDFYVDDDINEDEELYVLMDYTQFSQFVFEWIGRVLTTTVMFSDVLLGMVLQAWSTEEERISWIGSSQDVDIRAFDKAFKRKSRDADDGEKSVEEKEREQDEEDVPAVPQAPGEHGDVAKEGSQSDDEYADC